MPITVVVLPEDEAAARRLFDESTHHVSVSPRSSGTSGDRVNIDNVVAEIQALRRTDPQAAAALELAVARELEGETRDAFIEKMNQANGHESTANGVIASQIDSDVELDQDDIDAETDRILDHSDKEVGGRSTPDGSRVQIRSDGRVSRSSPKIQNPDPNKPGRRVRIDQNSNPTQEHNTGEVVQP